MRTCGDLFGAIARIYAESRVVGIPAEIELARLAKAAGIDHVDGRLDGVRPKLPAVNTERRVYPIRRDLLDGPIFRMEQAQFFMRILGLKPAGIADLVSFSLLVPPGDETFIAPGELVAQCGFVVFCFSPAPKRKRMLGLALDARKDLKAGDVLLAVERE